MAADRPAAEAPLPEMPPEASERRGGDDPRVVFWLAGMWVFVCVVFVALPIAAWTKAFRGPGTNVPWLVTACVFSAPYALGFIASMATFVQDNYICPATHPDAPRRTPAA